ncbi:CHAT domain-containing protein [Tenacibaculum sp. 190130A14a]|uniref:CHAT domain-containing protein n=1 Tax=Tenacibaculum polynesiense TaxID=3137857 RepID=A0ABM9P6X4_9FLAO
MSNRKLKNLITCLFVFYLHISIAIGQFSYKEISYKYKNEKLSLEKVDSILSTFLPKDSTYAQIAHNFSYYFYKKKRLYDLAIQYGKIEVAVLDSLNLKNDNYTNALYNLGKFHFYKKEFDTAIMYYQQAINSNKFPKKIGQSYCELGKIYHFKGDLYKALNYYNYGINILKTHGSLKSKISQYISLAYACKDMNTKNTTILGIASLQKADSIIKENNNLNTSHNFYTLNTNYANLYALKHQYNFNKAKKHYQKNLKRALNEHNEEYIINSYLNLGELYLNEQKDSSLFFLQKSIQFDIDEIEDKTMFSEAHRILSNYYVSKNNLTTALEHINTSLSISFNSEQLKLLSQDVLINALDKPNIIRALKGKNEILIKLHELEKQQHYLDEAIFNTNFANRFIQTIIEFSSETDTKFLWRAGISDIFELGIKSAYLLSKPSLMFEFSEKNKAFLLTQSIHNNEQNSGLPDRVKNLDISFRKQILHLEEHNSSTLKKDSLFNLKEKYISFKDSISQLYPLFTNYKKKSYYTPLSLVQKKLSHNQIVCSFSNISSNDSINNIYGIVISKNKIFPFTSILSNQTYNTYKELISKPLKNKFELDNFKIISFKLYNQLFPSNEIKELLKNKNLIIIPDVSFENIPFESLITEENKVKYLVESSNISYAYSYSFLDYNKQLKRNTNIDFVSFAPVNFSNPKLNSLNNTLKETNNIGNLINGTQYLYKQASKANFFDSSSHSKIIHLATHANSSQTPTIYFTKDSLKLHELYTFKNNADLVVLSACETNLGKIKKGEGTLSLSRGFFHSGTNSVLSSLWNVNDKSTSFIMNQFYKNLLNKQSKSDALNNAKRVYLKKHSLTEQSPYYWASFVLIGDTQTVFNSNLWIYIYSAISLIIFLVIFIYFKKTSLKSSRDN